MEHRISRIEKKIDRLYFWAFGYEPGERSVARAIRDMEEWVERHEDLSNSLDRRLEKAEDRIAMLLSGLEDRKEGKEEMSRARMAMWIAIIASIVGVVGGLIADILRALIFVGGANPGGGI